MIPRYYYYRIIRKTIIQFLNMFSNIEIGRFDNDGYLQKKIVVPIKFGSKEKAYYWVKENRRVDEVLPLISVNHTGIDFDAARMTAKYETITSSVDTDNHVLTYFSNPIPYNVGLNVNIWTLHHIDADQILEQILPNFIPHRFIQITVPELDATFDNKVIFNSAVPDISEDMAEEDWRIIKWTLSFTIQTYFFNPLVTTGGGNNPIEKIIINYYTNLKQFESIDTTSVFTSAAPEGGVTQYWEFAGYDEDAKILLNYEKFE